MPEELEQLQKELADLKQWKASLERSSTIPLNIDQAFRERFKGLGTIIKTQSAKGVNTEDVTVVNSVNFIAQTAGTTVVLNDPTQFLKVEIDGTIYYLAAWVS